MKQSNIVAGKSYKHYRGRVYTVVFISIDANSNEKVIAYKDLNGINVETWSLTESEFTKGVEWNGGIVPRFELTTTQKLTSK